MDHNSMETYFGLIRTPHDALIIFEACRLGIVSRVHRRLSDIERQSVRSGSVFCFDEREAGMRRWTDGKSWSPSRVTGSFLTYRELEDSQSNLHAKNIYRPDGLLKQSFSITTSDHRKLHLISYYTNEDVSSERLCNTPSQDPRFQEIVVPKGVYPETSTAASDTPTPSTAVSSPSPPLAHRPRQRPHHRTFHNEDGQPKTAHRRTGSSSSTHSLSGHRRTNSGSLAPKDHRYSPVQAADGKAIVSRSRSNSNLAMYSTPYDPNSVFGQYRSHQRQKSSSPTGLSSSFPTPSSNAYSPSTSYASDDDLPFVRDRMSLGQGHGQNSSAGLNPILPALPPVLHTQATYRSKDGADLVHEQDSLSVLANLASHTPLLPKLEPQEVSRDNVRWVEDDRQLRALSSMLRL